MEIRPATIDDLPGWLALAREVEHLFGPMADQPAFRDGLREAIARGEAFCAGEAGLGEPLPGALAVSSSEPAIAWLAVAGCSRKQGLGRALLAHALAQLPDDVPIVVQTFAPGVPEGAAARRLYSSFGFMDVEPGEATPAGVATIIMARKPTSRSQ